MAVRYYRKEKRLIAWLVIFITLFVWSILLNIYQAINHTTIEKVYQMEYYDEPSPFEEEIIDTLKDVRSV